MRTSGQNRSAFIYQQQQHLRWGKRKPSGLMQSAGSGKQSPFQGSCPRVMWQTNEPNPSRYYELLYTLVVDRHTLCALLGPEQMHMKGNCSMCSLMAKAKSRTGTLMCFLSRENFLYKGVLCEAERSKIRT